MSILSKARKLLDNYSKYIGVPWRTDLAAAQRVIFCVYNQDDELRIRLLMDEYKVATSEAGHGWALFDLTDSFANWLSGQRYKKSYFDKPELISTLMPKYLEYIESQFIEFIQSEKVDVDTVVALMGVGSLFGFLRVKEVVDVLAPLVEGRLLVFFPGTMPGNNNYRLLDRYDGWNYLAVAITADKEMM